MLYTVGYMTHASEILFAGGVGSVTGAHFILRSGERIIAVDCGLIQGEHQCDDRNYDPFLQDPSTVDLLFITHAHLDHIGRIPKFVREGFRGTIYSTAPTRDIAQAMLADALPIMTEHAASCGREPLYRSEDIAQSFARWKTVDYHEEIDCEEAITAHFRDAGHIMGSAMVVFEREGKSFVFTGDLGNSPSPLLRDTESIAGASFLVMESVYGDRVHEGRDTRTAVLQQTIEHIRASRGTLLIPSFSIERTQVLLYELNELVESKRMRPLPIFLDSPLAAEITEIYHRYPQYLNDEARERAGSDSDIFSFPGLTVTVDAADSRAIADVPGPKVIIAGSGMSHGGRIRSHEKHYLGDPGATLLFVGYQVPGSLGRRIQDGAKKVMIDGDEVHVRAHTGTLSGYSAHKDRDMLVEFVAEAQDSLEEVFVVMGEPKTALFLTQRLREFLDVRAQAPAYGDIRTIAW